jgi:hypothetical protein
MTIGPEGPKLMLTHFALWGLPDWTKLSKVQRRFVWQQCLHPILANRRALDAKGAVLLLIFLGSLAWWMFGQSSFIAHPRVVYPLLVVVTAFFPPEFVDLVIVARQRKRVSQFIHDHGEEIAAAVR